MSPTIIEVPPELEEADLGPVVAIHGASNCSTQEEKYAWLIVGFVFLTGFLVVLFVRKAHEVNGKECAIAAALATPLSALALAYFVMERRKRMATTVVYRFEKGLAVRTDAGWRLVPWDAVASYWLKITNVFMNGVYARTEHLHLLRMKDGSKCELTHFYADIDGLWRAIADETTRQQLPEALATLAAGKPLTFGQILLNAKGVGREGIYMDWANVGAISAQKGKFLVEAAKSDVWFGGIVREVPNFFLMLEMFRRLAPPKALQHLAQPEVATHE